MEVRKGKSEIIFPARAQALINCCWKSLINGKVKKATGQRQRMEGNGVSCKPCSSRCSQEEKVHSTQRGRCPRRCPSRLGPCSDQFAKGFMRQDGKLATDEGKDRKVIWSQIPKWSQNGWPWKSFVSCVYKRSTKGRKQSLQQGHHMDCDSINSVGAPYLLPKFCWLI